jgi:hypothetical protein
LQEEIYSQWKRNNGKISSIRSHARIYDCIEKINRLYKQAMPMSGLLDEGKFYICYKKNEELCGIEIKLLEFREENGQVYYTMEWSERVIKVKSTMLNCIGFLLLPKQMSGVNVYCIIREDWSDNNTEHIL